MLKTINKILTVILVLAVLAAGPVIAACSQADSGGAPYDNAGEPSRGGDGDENGGNGESPGNGGGNGKSPDNGAPYTVIDLRGYCAEKIGKKIGIESGGGKFVDYMNPKDTEGEFLKLTGLNKGDIRFDGIPDGCELSYLGVDKQIDKQKLKVLFYGVFNDPAAGETFARYYTAREYENKDVVEFEYKSYYYNVLNLIVAEAPLADFARITDAFDKEYLIINGLAVSADFHWARNDFNGAAFDGSWTLQNIAGSYFHQLGGNNALNVKYTKRTSFFDYIEDGAGAGSYELVFNDAGELADDPLITYSFNFADSGADMAGHYIKDVYPYLIWGNTLADYLSRTAYERFVWDKDSADTAAIAARQFQIGNGDYAGKNLSGRELTDKYESGRISDGGGTPIPDAVKTLRRFQTN